MPTDVTASADTTVRAEATVPRSTDLAGLRFQAQASVFRRVSMDNFCHP